MGISRITAYTIASNDVETEAFGPLEGKYQGVITHSKDHPRHPCMMLLSTEFIFDTAEAAKQSMMDTVSEIRKAVNGEGTAV